MLSLAGTLIVLGSINPAQAALVAEPLVINSDEENVIQTITGLQVLNSDGSAIDVFTVDFQFDSFTTIFGGFSSSSGDFSPSSEAFFFDDLEGAESARRAINDAINGMTTTTPIGVEGLFNLPGSEDAIIVALNSYIIPGKFSDNDSNMVETLIGQFTNGAWVGNTTQLQPQGTPTMYAKFTKTGEINIDSTPTPTVPESSNLVSILIFGTSLLFVAKNRIR
ncbi:MAG: hypothetical protein QNJ66_07495 [Crocosphaera sp.]|nr:hypothetical protein [Crocosphaera sp.]